MANGGFVVTIMRFIPLVISVLAALLLLASGLGVRAEMWTFRTGFVVLRWAAMLALLGALTAIVALAVARWRHGNVGSLVFALLIALAVAYVPWSWQRKARSVPAIHDITTDMERPPQFVAVQPLRADAPNPAEYGGSEIAVQQREAYPDIQPLVLREETGAAFRRAHAAAEDMGWELVAADSAQGRIEATATTRWFGFKDDVVIRIEPVAEGSRIDVRSVSRVGRGDVGANAARIRAYIDRLKGGE
jgi:uncharacterized protein (DUF1499 family)